MGRLNILRSAEMNAEYSEYKKSNPNRASFEDWAERLVSEFNYWRLIENRFPLDRIAEKHHLLIPKRIFGDWEEMSEDERLELLEIKKTLAPDYDFLLENFPRHRSVPDHYHLHFIVVKSGNTQE